MYLDAAVHLESAVVLLTEANDSHDDEDVAGNVAQQLLELVGISGLAVGDHQRHENRAPEIPHTHARTHRGPRVSSIARCTFGSTTITSYLDLGRLPNSYTSEITNR